MKILNYSFSEEIPGTTHEGILRNTFESLKNYSEIFEENRACTRSESFLSDIVQFGMQ